MAFERLTAIGFGAAQAASGATGADVPNLYGVPLPAETAHAVYEPDSGMDELYPSFGNPDSAVQQTQTVPCTEEALQEAYPSEMDALRVNNENFVLNGPGEPINQGTLAIYGGPGIAEACSGGFSFGNEQGVDGGTEPAANEGMQPVQEFTPPVDNGQSGSPTVVSEGDYSPIDNEVPVNNPYEGLVFPLGAAGILSVLGYGIYRMTRDDGRTGTEISQRNNGNNPQGQRFYRPAPPEPTLDEKRKARGRQLREEEKDDHLNSGSYGRYLWPQLQAGQKQARLLAMKEWFRTDKYDDEINALQEVIDEKDSDIAAAKHEEAINNSPRNRWEN